MSHEQTRRKPDGQPHYLEMVTPDVDGVCALYAASLGVEFGEPVAGLGGARVAELPGGSRVGVRAPLRPDEGPLSRVYHRVDDLAAAVEGVRSSGATIALEDMDLGPDHGRIAIVIQGGVEIGFWQVA